MTQSEPLPLGWLAPDFNLSDTNSDRWSLEKFSDLPALLVVFTCNHCPYAQASWPLLVELYDNHHDQVGIVAINPNDPAQVPMDGVDQMENLRTQYGVTFPYLVDDQQQVAKSYHAQCTPDIYLFKNNGHLEFSLFYHGRINDNWQSPSSVTQHDLEDAIDALLGDQDPPLNQIPSMGCGIKWQVTK